ncbi:MAG: sigma-54 dependent transcriptional regulator [Planctomycetota bacterium]|nr:sigma-54 dependent transcriptional regulator [Planctomycetota bacterium]
MVRPLIVIIEDDEGVRSALSRSLEQHDNDVRAAATAGEGLAHLQEKAADLVLLDYRLPDADGLELLETIRRQWPDLPVIMMTGVANVATAVQAMHLGAYDYVSKPFGLDQMMFVVNKALEARRVRSEVQHTTGRSLEPFGFDRIVGESPLMREAKHVLRQLADSDARTILLQGESGTGKDLAAKVIHYNSHRAERPFMNITCTALPEPLLESELFGHEKGAFTDARQQKLGLFELAGGGTIFLDEIGDMPATLQAKLLRFLDEKTFRRVGGTRDIQMDVCIIAATNRVLRALVEQGEFREDLFYRLNIFPVTLPPLRERREDIPLLVEFLLAQYNRELHKNVLGIDKTAMAVMQAYHWPGHIRELRNLIERAMLMARGGVLTLADLPTELKTPAAAPAAEKENAAASTIEFGPEGVDIREVERSLILKALTQAGWNQSRAAELLHMSRDQLRYRAKKFGLKPPARRPGPWLAP